MARWASRNMRAKSAPATPRAAEKEEAQKAAAEAVGETLDVFQKFFLDGKTFIGGDHPSIADIRLACSLEFLDVIDYHLPEWAKTYMGAVAKALGDAYAEPAKDVEGYIAYVKGQKKPNGGRQRLTNAATPPPFPRYFFCPFT